MTERLMGGAAVREAAGRFNADGLILSDHFGETMNECVLPALAEKRVVTTVKGFGNKPIVTSFFSCEAPRGTVVIVHGFTESAVKFSELTWSLLRNGFSVLAYDQRGHGRSWRREGLPDMSLTHVDDFEEYVRDFEIICAGLLADMPRPYFMFAHSMGGAVASLFLERHQGVFAKAALCAPMIAPNTYGIPAGLVKLLCDGAKLLGKSTGRPSMSKPYSGPEDFETSCATGRERFAWYEGEKAGHPEYRNCNPSFTF